MWSRHTKWQINRSHRLIKCVGTLRWRSGLSCSSGKSWTCTLRLLRYSCYRRGSCLKDYRNSLGRRRPWTADAQVAPWRVRLRNMRLAVLEGDGDATCDAMNFLLLNETSIWHHIILPANVLMTLVSFSFLVTARSGSGSANTGEDGESLCTRGKRVCSLAGLEREQFSRS